MSKGKEILGGNQKVKRSKFENLLNAFKRYRNRDNAKRGTLGSHEHYKYYNHGHAERKVKSLSQPICHDLLTRLSLARIS